MSLRSLRRRLEQVEGKLRVGFVIVKSPSGEILRVPERAVFSLLGEAVKASHGFDGRVLDEALTPCLRAIRDAVEFDEPGSHLLELIQVCLCGPAADPPQEISLKTEKSACL